MMSGVYPGDSRYMLEVFCLYEGEGEFFDLGKEPIERVPFSFGGFKGKEKGYVIKNNCIRCGVCKGVCPQDAIDEGTPYRIRDKNCLHCGLCKEKCQVQAIERK